MRALSASVVVPVVLVLGVVAAAQPGSPASPSLLKATFGKLPIYFVENRGVYPDEVAYYVQGADKTLFFTKQGITFRMKGRDRDWVVKLEFVGANPDVVPRGEDRQQAVFSYFQGPEMDWKTGLRTFSKIVYRDLWPGIDLVYKGTVNRLKYEFLVRPGVDPGKIRLRYRGATHVEQTESGGLWIETPAGDFEDAPPVAYQQRGTERDTVAAKVAPSDVGEGCGHEFRFLIGDHDPARVLVIDPAILVYCGYIGGSGGDGANDVAVDSAGNAYIVGGTTSSPSTFPVKVGPSLSTFGGDAFVAKLDSSGTSLIYCGYIGGWGTDTPTAVAIDSSGCAYVAGSTNSDQRSFPVKVGPQLTFHYGGFAPRDGFIAKVNAAGTGLVYCGYVGGFSPETVGGVAVDVAGNAYVVGETGGEPGDPGFPMQVGPDLTGNGRWDAFIAKVNPSGSGFVYCGFIGGAGDEGAGGVAVDASGNAYVAGATTSTEATFPVTVGPDLTNNAGGNPGGILDGFVAKVNAQGTALVYCGFVGGSGQESINDIAIDASGNAYVAGRTDSDQTTFPVRIGPCLAYGGGPYFDGSDGFVARVNAQGTALDYCGYIGGNQWERAESIAVDVLGNAYVCGYTASTEATFPVKGGPDLTFNDTGGFEDGFVAKVNAQGTALVYCGYIGGAIRDFAEGIAVDPYGNAYVVGMTANTETTFPVKVGPDLTNNGGLTPSEPFDGFIAKVAYTYLSRTGLPRVGLSVTLSLTASDDFGYLYQVGSSLGTGPIPIDTRRLDLSPDFLLAMSVGNLWPSVFVGYRGIINNLGQAQATIHIPTSPLLIGTQIHTAFVTLDLHSPSGIRSISNTDSFTITK